MEFIAETINNFAFKQKLHIYLQLKTCFHQLQCCTFFLISSIKYHFIMVMVSKKDVCKSLISQVLYIKIKPSLYGPDLMYMVLFIVKNISLNNFRIIFHTKTISCCSKIVILLNIVEKKYRNTTNMSAR